MKGDVGTAGLHTKMIVQSCIVPEPELCKEGVLKRPLQKHSKLPKNSYSLSIRAKQEGQ